MHYIDTSSHIFPHPGTVAADGLYVGYASGQSRRTVAGPLDCTLRQGTLTCLIGRNGTGKSTLLRTLAGLQPPLAGTVRIGGTDITAMSRQQIAQTLAIVLTQRPDAADLTVEQAVALGRSPYTGFWGRLSPDDRTAIDEAMRSAGVDRMRSRRVCSLSDGECQKVMIAKAVAQHTPVVLLDEPTAFLDFPAKIELMLALRRMAHQCGKTVLLSTHDLETALHTADRLWLLSPQGIVQGTPGQLAADGSIRRYIGRDDVDIDCSTMNIVLKVEKA